VVALNAAAALLVAGRVADLKEGVDVAKRAIDDGRVVSLLETIKELSHS
jgi:anthranilate phosphoribosyltransferase